MADLPITSDEGATPVVINDPTTTANVANVKAASTAAVAGDNSLVVALSPNSPIPIGTNKIGVTGVAQGSTTSGQNGDLIQGAVTTSSPLYVTAQTSPLSLTTAGALRTDASATTQPISGTVTSNQGTAAALAAAWPVEITDGTNILGTSAHPVVVDGPVASGSANSGGPVKTGAVFNTTQPTVTTGQVVDAQSTARGARIVATGVDAFNVNLADSGGSPITLGQTTMAASLPVVIASNQTSITTTFGLAGATKSKVMETGSLVTTAVTANQVVLTYTVTAGKTLNLEYVQMSAFQTTLAGNTNPIHLGTIQLETPSGTAVVVFDVTTTGGVPAIPGLITFSEPLQIASGTVIRVTTTPVAATSFTWRANFGGYEA